MSWLKPTVTNAPQEHADRLRVAMAAAIAAGDALMLHFERGVSARDKADGSPVTDADLEAESTIRNAISNAFPNDGQLGEEHGLINGDNDWRWVIDPIDGTISFIHGVLVFGTLIGIEYEGTPVAGVMHFPGLNETVWATDAGAFWKRGDAKPTRACVSNTTQLADAMVCMTSLDYCDDDHDPWLRVHGAAKRTRGWSDCHASSLLVTGRVDAVIEPELKPWDCSAIIAVLRHAGGRFTDWNGEHDNDSSVQRGVSSNALLHDELCALLAPG